MLRNLRDYYSMLREGRVRGGGPDDLEMKGGGDEDEGRREGKDGDWRVYMPDGNYDRLNNTWGFTGGGEEVAGVFDDEGVEESERVDMPAGNHNYG